MELAVTRLATGLTFALARLDREIALRHVTGGLRPSELAVLDDLQQAGASTAGALASAERMRPASLTRHITALERLGLIRRAKVDGDLRQAMLTVTRKGKAMFADTCRDAWLTKRIGQLTIEEQAALRDAIPVIVTLYQDGSDRSPALEETGEGPEEESAGEIPGEYA